MKIRNRRIEPGARYRIIGIKRTIDSTVVTSAATNMDGILGMVLSCPQTLGCKVHAKYCFVMIVPKVRDNPIIDSSVLSLRSHEASEDAVLLHVDGQASTMP